MSEEDIRQIVENVTGFFDKLAEWQREREQVSNCSGSET